MSAGNRKQKSARTRRLLNVEALEQRQVMTALVMGGITSGSISAADQAVDYTFAVPAHAKVELILTSTPTQGPFVATGDVLDPANNIVSTFAYNSGNDFGNQ